LDDVAALPELKTRSPKQIRHPKSGKLFVELPPPRQPSSQHRHVLCSEGKGHTF
jgi:hypothetical protein